MVQVPMYDEFMPAKSLHPGGRIWSGSSFSLAFAGRFALAKEPYPEKYYSTAALHECLVLLEPKHRNRGI
jgi:hypothetical protein